MNLDRRKEKLALIVQKFGGTSVKSEENRKAALQQILAAKQKGHDVVVVVSAMGRRGDPYATDTLIDLLKAHSDKICPKKKDLIMACGEIISASVMAAYIEANGMAAEAMTGFQAGIVTTEDFGNAEILEVNIDPVMDRLQEGKVVVVAGFQGQTKKGEITTLGRGGSDTTAVVLGGYLKADMIEIYTDVPGVAVTDPRVIPEAPFIPEVSYDEVLAMAQSGAKVIHPRAVKAAKKFNLPFRIKSTFDKGEGTLISNKSSKLEIAGITLQEDTQDFSKISVVYGCGEGESIKTKISQALIARNIPLKSHESLSAYCSYTVPEKYKQKAIETIFFKFF